MSTSTNLLQGTIGVGGTIAAVALRNLESWAAIFAGVATGAWMLRQLYLSWRK